MTSYELAVSGGDPDRLRRELAAEAARRSVDLAVQRAGLHRRAKHLIVLDVDSTLLQGEVIDLLAERAGCADEVAAVTASAMAGEVDFADAMHERLALLAGLDAKVLEEVADGLLLAPGARTLIRTLERLGYVTALVSGGFVQIIEGLAAALGIDHLAANTLEVVNGRLTGRLVGPMVDRAGKATAPRAVRRSPPACRWRRRWRSATARTTSTCWPWPVSGSPSTPNRRSGGRRTRRSTSRTSTPSSSSSASPGRRSRLQISRLIKI